MEGSHTTPNHRHQSTAAIVAGTTVFGTLALMSPFVFTRSPLPFMATPSRKIRKALDSLPYKKTFVDLGSGDGEAVYQATQVGYEHAIGIELNYTMWMIARIRRLFWSSDGRSRSQFVCTDMFSYNVSSADTLMIFGVQPLMKPLSHKLAKECKAGTHILCYRFQMPTQSSSGDNSLLVNAAIVYNQEEMRIYKVL